MKILVKKSPRIFKVGKLSIMDCGKIYLKKNEQITFITDNKASHDVTRKDWGFYATQSTNSRLKKNFKTALVANKFNKIYVMLVEKKKYNSFKKYCKEHKQEVLIWLDEI